MKTKQDRTPSEDTIMENIAVYDALERAGFSEVVIDRIVRAVNSHEALLEAAKRALRSYGSNDPQTSVIKQLEIAIAKAEGKGE